LADAGIQLGQTQVGAENSKHTAQHEKNGENPSFGRPTRADDSRNMSTEEARTASLSGFTGSGSGRGLVDIFA
jgi:flagellar hook-length control protein FliK